MKRTLINTLAIVCFLLSAPIAFYGLSMATGCCGASSSSIDTVLGLSPGVALGAGSIILLTYINVPLRYKRRAFKAEVAVVCLIALGLLAFFSKYWLDYFR